jgi:hypothetical protein
MILFLSGNPICTTGFPGVLHFAFRQDNRQIVKSRGEAEKKQQAFCVVAGWAENVAKYCDVNGDDFSQTYNLK